MEKRRPVPVLSFDGRQWERTGERRAPRRGEWFAAVGPYRVVAVCASEDYDEGVRRSILREIKPEVRDG